MTKENRVINLLESTKKERVFVNENSKQVLTLEAIKTIYGGKDFFLEVEVQENQPEVLISRQLDYFEAVEMLEQNFNFDEWEEMI